MKDSTTEIKFDYDQNLRYCKESDKGDGLHNWVLLGNTLTFFCTQCGIKPPSTDGPRIIPYAHRGHIGEELLMNDEGKEVVVGIPLPLWALRMRLNDNNNNDKK